MKKVLKIIKDKIQRQLFWLPTSLIKLIEKEVKEKKKGNWKNESALMTHIIINWFSK